MEYSSQVEIEFLEIITETGNITLTGSHNVFYYKDGKATPTYAENLRPGNVIVAGSGAVNKTHFTKETRLIVNRDKPGVCLLGLFKKSIFEFSDPGR